MATKRKNLHSDGGSEEISGDNQSQDDSESEKEDDKDDHFSQGVVISPLAIQSGRNKTHERKQQTCQSVGRQLELCAELTHLFQ